MLKFNWIQIQIQLKVNKMKINARKYWNLFVIFFIYDMVLKKNNFEKTQIWKDNFPFHSKEQMW
jgi:hypothetical protein